MIEGGKKLNREILPIREPGRRVDGGLLDYWMGEGQRGAEARQVRRRYAMARQATRLRHGFAAASYPG